MSYHHGNLKDALVMAAENLLERDGLNTLSLRQTAERAGVSHNAPYRHFRDKAALFDEVLQKTLTDLAEKTLAAPLLYPASLLMQLQHVGRVVMQMACRSPQRAHLLFSYQSPTPNSALAAGFELLRQNLRELLTAYNTEYAIDSTRTETLSIHLIALWRGLAGLQTSALHRDYIRSEDELFEISDEAIENLLKSFMR
jgi:AcrR family transcriptional regulator